MVRSLQTINIDRLYISVGYDIALQDLPGDIKMIKFPGNARARFTENGAQKHHNIGPCLWVQSSSKHMSVPHILFHVRLVIVLWRQRVRYRMRIGLHLRQVWHSFLLLLVVVIVNLCLDG